MNKEKERKVMGAEVFAGNLAVCPECNTQFEHNKINGVALVQAINDIDARKRMHLRLSIDALERLDLDRPAFNATRKVILDGFNEFNRDVQTILGLADEVE